MLDLQLTYLSAIGLIYLVVAIVGMIAWKTTGLPRLKGDRHCFNEAIIGISHIAVDILIHLPSLA